jgi:myo-inositol-1-phosphate synthase
VKLGVDAAGKPVYIPFKNLLPMVDPSDLVIGGWDICSQPLSKAMHNSRVLDYGLQQQLAPHMDNLVPLPGIHFGDFIAANQAERADNTIAGDKQTILETIRSDIRKFKEANQLDKVIIVWTANTERFSSVQVGVNDSAESLLAAIKRSEEEVSPSTLYATAAVLEGCSYLNGSPQVIF